MLKNITMAFRDINQEALLAKENVQLAKEPNKELQTNNPPPNKQQTKQQKTQLKNNNKKPSKNMEIPPLPGTVLLSIYKFGEVFSKR